MPLIEAFVVTDEELRVAEATVSDLLNDNSSPFSGAVARDLKALIGECTAFKKAAPCIVDATEVLALSMEMSRKMLLKHSEQTE